MYLVHWASCGEILEIKNLIGFRAVQFSETVLVEVDDIQ
jgi:hypothetical protein